MKMITKEYLLSKGFKEDSEFSDVYRIEGVEFSFILKPRYNGGKIHWTTLEVWTNMEYHILTLQEIRELESLYELATKNKL